MTAHSATRCFHLHETPAANPLSPHRYQIFTNLYQLPAASPVLTQCRRESPTDRYQVLHHLITVQSIDTIGSMLLLPPRPALCARAGPLHRRAPLLLVGLVVLTLGAHGIAGSGEGSSAPRQVSS